MNEQEGFKWFIAGFVAGEGCFSVYLQNITMMGVKKIKRYNYPIVHPEFKITQHKWSGELLNKIKSFFKCGHIYKFNNILNYRVINQRDLATIIIPFFDKYHLFNSHKMYSYMFWRDIILKLYYRKKRSLSKSFRKYIFDMSRKINPNGIKRECKIDNKWFE